MSAQAGMRSARTRSSGRSSPTASTSTCASSEAGLAGLTVAREVARRGWSVAVLEARRVARKRVRPRLRLRAARTRRRRPPDGRTRRPRPRQGAVEALRGGRRVCAHDHPRDRDAGHRAGRRLARRLQGRPRRRAARHRDPARLELGAENRGLAGPTGAPHATDPSRYFHAIHYPNAFHIDPLAYALWARQGGDRGQRPSSSRRRRRTRGIDAGRGAQARRHPEGAGAGGAHRPGRQHPARRAGARPRRHRAAGDRPCGGDGAARRRGSARRSPGAAPSATAGPPTTTTGSSAATG